MTTLDWTIETIRSQFRNTCIDNESHESVLLIRKHECRPYIEWKDDRMAYFMQSVKKGVPMPPIVFSGSLNDFKLIDGRNRIQAILNFYEESFENIPMRGVFFEGISDDEVFDLYSRLNFNWSGK